MKRGLRMLVLLIATLPRAVLALDPPHDTSRSITCANCHIAHHAVGGAITNVAGNPNLCMSCHTAAGVASTKPFANSDEAIPGVGGTSHRWDSGASGWVKPNPANTSSGSVQSGGSFSGSYSKNYTITVTTAGDTGTAVFSWNTSKPVRQTYRDELTAIAFNGSNGTLSWTAAPWTEIVEADGVSAGVIRVVASAVCASGNCLRIGGGTINTIGVRRLANVVGSTAAMLTFSYQRQLSACPKTSAANVALQVSSDGTTWVTLATYNLSECDTGQVAQSFDVTPYIAATTQIRFLGSGTAAATDFIYVDNVQVEALANASAVTNVTTAGTVALDEGITVAFANGASSPSFKLSDQWTVYANADVQQPASLALAARLANGKVTCSSCHNEHSQVAEPFDSAAKAYPTPGSSGSAGPGGEGRHNQRLDNDTNQMCGDCHSTRIVTAASQGSHPVGVSVPSGNYKPPATLPLDKRSGQVRCMSCHRIHNSPTSDGSLLRMTSTTSLCTDCHTLADTTSPAAHLAATTGALWPGPGYGTLFPRIADTTKRGSCANCHQSHGWPDNSIPGQDYPALLVNREENLCYACHDGSPVAKNLLLLFTKSYRHPTGDYSGRHSAGEGGDSTKYGTSNRHAECEDCHNPHRARADAAAPVAPAASNRLLGAARVAVTNGAAGTVPTYTFRGSTDSTAPIAEYQVCFKCHSSWTSQPVGQTDLALRFNPNNRSYHSVEAIGKNTNININSFINGWTGTKTMYCTDCHTGDDVSVRGPHGSQYRYLLSQPSIASSSRRLMASTEECFACHRFNTYANENATITEKSYSRFNLPSTDEGHTKHLGDHQYPCYACHDSHGSSTAPHMIVTGRNPGIISYTETATGGTCTPTCHDPESYTINYAR
ncbi:MAG: hypothetical protein HY270_02460 [Deltaproteobacteria bacterium]|nr:hypothetical protein [Deltaproteobacteria bacterium]